MASNASSDPKAESIIQDLAAFFKTCGKVLSRKEYRRIRTKPHSARFIEKHIGWNFAKQQAAMILAKDAPEEVLVSRPTTVSADDHDRLAIMAGLKKTGLPPKFRLILANLVMETEHSLLKLPRYSLPEPTTDHESAVLLLSDLHSGKSVFDDQGKCLYNQDIMTFRMGLVKEQLCRIIDERVAMKRLDQFVLAMIGDIVDGAGVYPGQELNQDLTCYVPQICLVAACIWDLILEIRRRGIPVWIKGVRGNHGRQYKYANAQNNFDYLVLQLLYMMAYTYDREGISVEYGNSPYMNFEVKGYRCHIRHEAPVQTETPAARAKFNGWRAMHDFDLIFYGHMHHPGNGSVLDCDSFMNGSLVGTDDLSESMGVFSRPSQTLIGIDPQFGRTYAYNLYADRFSEKGEAAGLLKKYPMLKTPF